MPRQARTMSSSGIYHIMLLGINQQQIFEDEQDYKRFLKILEECKVICEYKIYAYCLMGNHIHLLLERNNTGDGSLCCDVFGNQTAHYQSDPSTMVGMVYWAEQVIVHALTPFGYRGYCYDAYSGMYYLQSRYYDPQTGRFINADDTNYLNATGTVLGCNLFVYCENDAVNFVDPSGTTLIIRDNKNRVLSLLKKISNDSLSVDENGKVSYEVNNETKYVYGTGLVRALIACSKIITICETDSSKDGSYVYAENYYNSLLSTKNGKVTMYGKGSNSVVCLNLYDPSKSLKNPLYIILAHELIHAYRNARGMNIHYNILSASFQCKMIECFVVGLYKDNLPALMKHYVKYTENRIRKEHGLVLRTKYNRMVIS